MAEEIEIVNVGGDGVASEATLKSLADSIKKLAQATGKDPRAEEAKLIKTANEARKNGIKVIKDQNDAFDDLTDSTERAARATNNMSRGMGNLVLNGLGAVLGSAVNLGKELAFGGDRITDFARHLPIVGQHLAVLTQFVDESIDGFRQLANVGIDFGESIFEVRRQAAVAGVSLNAFQQALSNNSDSLARFGGTAQTGARRFAQISGNIQSSLGPAFDKLGMTMEQSADYTASYLAMQTRSGRAQTMTQGELSAGAAEYILQLDRLSKLTGKSREQLAAEMEASVTPGVNILMRNMEDGGAAFRGITQLLGQESAELSDAFAMLVERNGVPIMGTLSQGLAMLDPAIAGLAQRVQDGTATEEESEEALRRMITAAENFADEQGAQLAVLARNGDPRALAVSQLLGLGATVDAMDQAAAEQAAAMGDSGRGLLSFERSVADLRNGINENLANAGIFDGLQDIISYSLGEGLTTVLTGSVVVGAIAAAFGGAGALGRALSLATGGDGDDGGRRRGGRKGGGMMSRGLGGLGRGAGLAIAGIGAGLKAAGRGSLYIIGGGIAIGAAIAAIGAGIAGATWLMGEALPNLAEGLESFSDLDGDNLKRVAVGIGAMSVALGVFGAGTAIASVGNTISNIIDSLPGKTPLEKLIEFGNTSINSAQVEANATALKQFGEAMAGINLGEGAFSNMLANLFDGITEFFGGDTALPFTKIKAFSEADLGDAAKIKSNAESVVAFGTAMSSLSPLGDSFSTFTAQVFDGLSQAFFGNVVYPWDKVKLFAAADLDAVGIKTNAEAVVAFGNALKSIPQVDKERVGGLFNSIISGFIGTEVYPWNKVKLFAETDLDPNGFMTKNASSIAGFAAAVNASNATEEINTERVGGMFSAIYTAFFGTRVFPWEKVKTFGETDLDPNNLIVKNASAIAGFATAVNSANTIGEIDTERAGGLFGLVASAFAGNVQFPWDAVREFGENELDPNGNIAANAEAMAVFSQSLGGFANVDISNTVMPNVASLSEGIGTLNDSFDSEKIDEYEDALYNLRDTLDDLNEKIRENNALAAQTIGNQAAASGDGSGGSSRELIQMLSQLNTTMENIKVELDDQGDTHDRTMRAVRSLRPGI